MDLGSTLTQTARRWPAKIGFVFEGRRWTFDGFNRAVNKASHAFEADGIGHGDRVGFLTYNRPEQIMGYYALLKLGAVPVPINYRLSPAEVRYILDDSEARALVFEEATRAQVAPIASDLASVRRLVYVGASPEGDEVRFDRFIESASEGEPEAAVGPDDPAFVMYTSGTTGSPKGVVRTHRAELIGGMIMALECGFRHDDVVLANSPLFHIGQLQLQLLPFVQLGGTNVLTRGFDVEETLAVSAAERVTTLHGVPTQLVMLMEADLARYDLSALRIGFFGGQTLADDVVRRCTALFPDLFANLYGSTEALVVTVCDYRRHPDRLGSAGKPAIGMEARVVTPTGDGSLGPEPGAGVIGELVARGPSLMSGYLGLPERTASALAGGWYHTGDAAIVDEQGFFTVLGRLDHTIKTGGENVHPSEVENVLFDHPDVTDAAVVGLPSRRWGQLVCAAIVRRHEGLTEEALDAFCRAAPGLADFKRPRRYYFVDEIPASPTGKVDRDSLAALLRSRQPGPD